MPVPELQVGGHWPALPALPLDVWAADSAPATLGARCRRSAQGFAPHLLNQNPHLNRLTGGPSARPSPRSKGQSQARPQPWELVGSANAGTPPQAFSIQLWSGAQRAVL